MMKIKDIYRFESSINEDDSGANLEEMLNTRKKHDQSNLGTFIEDTLIRKYEGLPVVIQLSRCDKGKVPIEDPVKGIIGFKFVTEFELKVFEKYSK